MQKMRLGLLLIALAGVIGFGVEFTASTHAIQVTEVAAAMTAASAAVPAPCVVSTTNPVLTCLPHANNLAKQREHLALFALVPVGQATASSSSSGNWSSPSTWAGGVVPAANAKIIISAGTTVTYDLPTSPNYNWVRVLGTLTFSPTVSTIMNVDTIVVDPTATFTIGSAAAPLNPSVTAQIVITSHDGNPIDRTWDPFDVSRGVISHGLFQLYGAPTSPYVFLAQSAKKGDTTLTLASSPQNWQVGGRLVLPGVNYIPGPASQNGVAFEDENLKIASISGNVVTLTAALQFNHTLPANDSSVQVPVAYMDRNIVIKSANGDATAIPYRGHVMFMHTDTVQLSYALFEGLGRTSAFQTVTDPQVTGTISQIIADQGVLNPATTGNDRGRYAVHFHRGGAVVGNQATVYGIAVLGSPKLGIVNHDSNVDVENSVVYGADGSAFFTEIGTEIGSFKNDLAIHTVGDSSKPPHFGHLESANSDLKDNGTDQGSDGNGFWLQGGGVTLSNDMAFTSRAAGFAFFGNGFRAGPISSAPIDEYSDVNYPGFLLSNMTNPSSVPAGDIIHNTAQGDLVAPGAVPLQNFNNNTVVAANIGFDTESTAPIGSPNTLNNFTAVNVQLGINGYDASNIVLSNSHLAGQMVSSGTLIANQAGILVPDGIPGTQELQVANSTIEGFSVGIKFPDGVSTVSNTTLNNTLNVSGGEPDSGAFSGEPGNNIMTLTGDTFLHSYWPQKSVVVGQNGPADIILNSSPGALAPATESRWSQDQFSINGTKVPFPSQLASTQLPITTPLLETVDPSNPSQPILVGSSKNVSQPGSGSPILPAPSSTLPTPPTQPPSPPPSPEQPNPIPIIPVSPTPVTSVTPTTGFKFIAGSAGTVATQNGKTSMAVGALAVSISPQPGTMAQLTPSNFAIGIGTSYAQAQANILPVASTSINILTPGFVSTSAPLTAGQTYVVIVSVSANAQGRANPLLKANGTYNFYLVRFSSTVNTAAGTPVNVVSSNIPNMATNSFSVILQ